MPLTIFLLIFHLFSSNSIATSLYIRPFSEFTQTAPNIVRGVLNQIHSENGTTEEGGKTIYTFASMAVKEVIKGSINKNTVTLRKLGGTVDGVTLNIPSSVEFRENEDLVLFLDQENQDGTFNVIGMELGLFGLKEENGQMILTGGIFSFSKNANQDDHHIEADDLKENQKTWSLAQLKELLQSQTNGNPTPALLPRSSANSLTQNQNPATVTATNSDGEKPNNNQTSKSENERWNLGIAFICAAVIILTSSFFLSRKRRKNK